MNKTIYIVYKSLINYFPDTFYLKKAYICVCIYIQTNDEFFCKEAYIKC